MKKLLPLLGLLLAGCASGPYLPGSTTALGSDNALLLFNYSGVYGPVKVLRANPKPGQTVTYTTDGAVTIAWVATNWPGSVSNLTLHAK